MAKKKARRPATRSTSTLDPVEILTASYPHRRDLVKVFLSAPPEDLTAWTHRLGAFVDKLPKNLDPASRAAVLAAGNTITSLLTQARPRFWRELAGRRPR